MAIAPRNRRPKATFPAQTQTALEWVCLKTAIGIENKRSLAQDLYKTLVKRCTILASAKTQLSLRVTKRTTALDLHVNHLLINRPGPHRRWRPSGIIGQCDYSALPCT